MDAFLPPSVSNSQKTFQAWPSNSNKYIPDEQFGHSFFSSAHVFRPEAPLAVSLQKVLMGWPLYCKMYVSEEHSGQAWVIWLHDSNRNSFGWKISNLYFVLIVILEL